MLNKETLKNIKAGDYVWIGRQGILKNPRATLRKVSYITATQIVVTRPGLADDRFRRDNGSVIGKFRGEGITGVATPAEVTAWEKQQEQNRQARAVMEQAREAREQKRQALQELFAGAAIVHTDEEDRFNVEFTHLTERDVRELAARRAIREGKVQA